MNTFFRCKHIAARGTDMWTKMGFALHLTLSSVGKCWREQKADHVVFCLEGNSWRKDFYKPYKAQRKVARMALTESEQEEDEMFFEAYNDLTKFLDERTNVTMLQAANAEGDDMIAHWICTHPNDEHVIISSDTDFYQLLAENVQQFNGVTNELHTINGIFNEKGKRVKVKKTGEDKPIPDPAWELFLKCVRGDKSDNIFSAYPGVRVKGTKNKVGIQEAFADRGNKGYSWNNFMLQRWVDHDKVEHKVLKDYERNVTLVDLSAQPEWVKDEMDIAVAQAYVKERKKQVGGHFLKFCGKYDLVKLSEQADNIAKYLNAPLPDFENGS